MLNNTEDLIRQVFDEMVKVKPRLANDIRYNDDDSINFPKLGNEMVENFPWPIGIELRRLFTKTTLGRDLLTHIFRTFERTLQFISFIMVAQLMEEKVRNRISIPENFKKEFKHRFPLLSLGDYTWLITSIGNFLKQQNFEWFIPEISENFNKGFYENLNSLVLPRNILMHFQSNPTDQDIERDCIVFEEKLTRLLSKIAFLVNYKLVYVKDIKVVKSKNHEAFFHHSMDLLHNTHSDFSTARIEGLKFTESNSVLLMKQTKSIGEYLNLSPLVIDTKSEVINDLKRFSIIGDIYLYSKYSDGHLMYVGTEAPEVCDLRSLHNYSTLVDEFNEILSVLSS
ncbi:MAG: hypothetical protein NTW16_17795 [Bacteroidetes bacterium]|nr:hypothetical protein [Bacteroidota bacterium]